MSAQHLLLGLCFTLMLELSQMGRVNKAFGLAVKHLIHTQPRMCLSYHDSVRFQHPINLHSKLMLGWAPLITHLYLEISPSFPAGVSEILALSHLTSLTLYSWNEEACPCSGTLLQHCSHLKMLRCHMHLVHAHLPPSLQRLELCSTIDKSFCIHSIAAADSFMLHLAGLAHLQHLTLQLESHGVLPSRTMLPVLQHLIRGFSLAGRASLDLSWLHRQPCQKLWVHVVHFDHEDTSIVDQLQQLHMQLSRLEFIGEIPPLQ